MRGGDPTHSQDIDAKGVVFPACAGVIPSCLLQPKSSMSLPRMRGGDPDGFKKTINFYKSSPHARG